MKNALRGYTRIHTVTGDVSFLPESAHEKHFITDVSLQMWRHLENYFWQNYERKKKNLKNYHLFRIVLLGGNFCNGTERHSASKNGVETNVLRNGFSIVRQHVCGSPQIAYSNTIIPICMQQAHHLLHQRTQFSVDSVILLWEFWCTRHHGYNEEQNKA